MKQQGPTREFDPLLLPFLRAPDREEAALRLDQLLSEHASPTSQAIIRSKLGVSLRATDGRHDNQEALEIESEVATCLVAELNELRESLNPQAISNFKSYVAVVTFHACSKHLRQRNPARAQLKNSLRYLLTTRPELALWQDGTNSWVCGLEQWRSREYATAHPGAAGGWTNDDLPVLEIKHVEHMPLEELLATVLREAKQPVAFGRLVNTIAELKGIKDQTRLKDANEEDASKELAQLPDPRPDIATELVQRAYMQKLWTEICELPPKQRAALLLNLKDANGRGMIAMFPLTSVATVPQLAATLEIPLERFAAIWNELPWEDTSVSTHLGITRQQVVNLRKCARERLARRMKEF